MLCLVAQSCPTPYDPVDCSPPGSSIHGILQARILEWVTSPPPGDLPIPGTEPGSSTLQVDSLPAELPWTAFIQVISEKGLENLSLASFPSFMPPLSGEGERTEIQSQDFGGFDSWTVIGLITAWKSRAVFLKVVFPMVANSDTEGPAQGSIALGEAELYRKVCSHVRMWCLWKKSEIWILCENSQYLDVGSVAGFVFK